MQPICLHWCLNDCCYFLVKQAYLRGTFLVIFYSPCTSLLLLLLLTNMVLHNNNMQTICSSMLLHQVLPILSVFITLNNVFSHYLLGLQTTLFLLIKINLKLYCSILTSKQSPFMMFTAVNVAGTMNPHRLHWTLGVVLDKCLSMKHHVTILCKGCFFHIQALHHIRPAINSDTAETIASSLVSCRLDYANWVLHSISTMNIKLLQRSSATLLTNNTNTKGTSLAPHQTPTRL